MLKPPALTATFTQAPSCLSRLYATNYATSSPATFRVNLGLPIDYSVCFPPGWATDLASYFSPGVCPSGYTSACSTYSSLPPITSEETTIICCPSGYICGTYPPPFICTSTITSNPQTILDLYTTGHKSGSYIPVSGEGVNAFPVQVRFQATDVNPHATRLVTDVQSSDLPTGAKAGIGVGVTIGVALLLLGALLLKRRMQRPKIDQAPGTSVTPYGIDSKQELDGTSYATPKVRDASLTIAEIGASSLHSDFTSSQPGTRLRDSIPSMGGAETHTPTCLTSTESSALAAPHARSVDVVESPIQTTSREVSSNVTHTQEQADAVPETQSAVSAPYGVSLGELEGEQDIRRQIKRIRAEKERLTRINELERSEAELQKRLAGLSTSVK